MCVVFECLTIFFFFFFFLTSDCYACYDPQGAFVSLLCLLLPTLCDRLDAFLLLVAVVVEPKQQFDRFLPMLFVFVHFFLFDRFLPMLYVCIFFFFFC